MYVSHHANTRLLSKFWSEHWRASERALLAGNMLLRIIKLIHRQMNMYPCSLRLVMKLVGYWQNVSVKGVL